MVLFIATNLVRQQINLRQNIAYSRLNHLKPTHYRSDTNLTLHNTVYGWGEKAAERLEVIKGRILDDVGEGENKDVPWWYKFRINYLFGNHL